MKKLLLITILFLSGCVTTSTFFLGDFINPAPKVLQTVHSQVNYEIWQSGRCEQATNEYKSRLLAQGYAPGQLKIEPRSVYTANDHIVLIVDDRWILDKNKKHVQVYK